MKCIEFFEGVSVSSIVFADIDNISAVSHDSFKNTPRVKGQFINKFIFARPINNIKTKII